MRRAVENVFTLMMVNIILRTPKPGEPPEPAAQKYIRTGRLVSGWAPAAERYGIPIAAPRAGGPSREGAYQDLDMPDKIHLTAINAVPYGGYVENGSPTVPAYHMVGGTLMQLRDNNVLADEIKAAWESL